MDVTTQCLSCIKQHKNTSEVDINRNQTKMVQVLFLIVIVCVEPFERKRNRQHDFCEYRQGDIKCISSPANEQLCTGAHNRCTVTKMINLSENVARMRKRHRRVLLDFDLSGVIFNVVIRREIYWLKLILARITISLAKSIEKFHK